MREYLLLAGLCISLPAYCWALSSGSRYWIFWFGMLGIFGVGILVP